jgi:heat-inducible transcriptional repressor
VFSDGTVTKHSVLATFEASHVEVTEASRQLNALLIGTSLDGKVQVPSRTDTTARLVREAVSVLHAQVPTTEGDQVYIGGSSKVADVFEGVETVRKVLGILEQELLVVSLVEDMLDQGLSVAIGSEHGFEPLSSCAVIVAPVSLEGETIGAVGLLGPTRMKYQEVMAAAEAVSQHLSSHFGGEGERG